MKKERDTTTIELKKKTKAELNEICKKTESFDDLINRLLVVFKKSIK